MAAAVALTATLSVPVMRAAASYCAAASSVDSMGNSLPTMSCTDAPASANDETKRSGDKPSFHCAWKDAEGRLGDTSSCASPATASLGRNAGAVRGGVRGSGTHEKVAAPKGVLVRRVLPAQDLGPLLHARPAGHHTCRAISQVHGS